MSGNVGFNLTANGSSAGTIWAGGKGNWAAYGDFGGGTLTMEISWDNGTTWQSAGTDGAFTANSQVVFELGACQLRGTLAGATSPDVNGTFRHIDQVTR